MKIYLCIIVVLLAMCIFFGIAWQSEKEAREDRDRTIIALTGENKAYKKELEKRNRDVIELQKIKNEDKELAKTDSIDWDTRVGDTVVIMRLKSRVH